MTDLTPDTDNLSPELDALLDKATSEPGELDSIEELEQEAVEEATTDGGSSITYKGEITGQTDGIELRMLEEEMKSSYLNYAMSVIVSRALPDVRDGLKPVHRRILFAMYKEGLTPGAKYSKCAGVVGEVLKHYHPHGDGSVYNALVRLAQDFSMRDPLIDGQGNFGSIDGDSPAAYRYTECKMQQTAAVMLKDIEKKTVDFVDNFDGTKQQPTVLPSLFPNLLVNGQTGIAVGMATEIPPHNLVEVCSALIAQLEKPDITIEELAEYIQGPDLPTGATLFGKADILNAYKTGRGKVMCRAKATLEESRIIITEVPYQLNKAEMLEKIATMVRDKRIDGIKDIRDESNKDGIRVVFETKRDASPEVVLNMLYKQSDLQKAIHFNLIALVNRGKQPKLLNLKEILTEYLAHRNEIIVRRTEFDLAKAKSRLHILDGLLIALDDIDKVIEIIRGSSDKDDATKNLIKEFKLSEIQTEAILQMRLQTLAGLERKKIKDEHAELSALAAELQKILDDPELRQSIVKEEIQETSDKLGSPRRTEIIKHSVTNYNKEDFVEEEDVIIQFTNSQYIKCLPLDTFRRQNRGGRGSASMKTKDEDFIKQTLVANTHDYVYAFTDTGRVFRTRVFDLPSGSRTGRGQNLINYLALLEGEKISQILTITKEQEENKEGSIFFATKQGRVKRTKLADYNNIRNTGIIAIKLNDDDKLISVGLSMSDAEKVVMSGNNGKTVIFDRDQVRPMGRSAAGVGGLKLKEDQETISMQISDFMFASGDEEETKSKDKFPSLLVVTENGYGKQTYLGEYRKTKRAAAGVKTMNITAKTGKPVIIEILTGEEEDLLVTTKNGVTIKMEPSAISHLGRATQGVKVINLDKDDVVVSGGLN